MLKYAISFQAKFPLDFLTQLELKNADDRTITQVITEQKKILQVKNNFYYFIEKKQIYQVKNNFYYFIAKEFMHIKLLLGFAIRYLRFLDRNNQQKAKNSDYVSEE